MELKKLSQMVQMLVNSQSGETATATDLPDDIALPMETLEDLRTVEKKSENKENICLGMSELSGAV